MVEFVAFAVAGVLGALQAGTLDRPEISEAQLKALREKNIFSPFRTKPFPKKPEPGAAPSKAGESSAAPAVSRPRPPVLTGIVYDQASKGFQAIFEDRNEERLRQLTGPKFCTAGDEVLGVTIEQVTREKVTVLRGEVRKELGVGEPLWEADGSSPAGAAVEAKPLDPAVTNSVLEELKKRNKKKDRSYDEP